VTTHRKMKTISIKTETKLEKREIRFAAERKFYNKKDLGARNLSQNKKPDWPYPLKKANAPVDLGWEVKS